jgi:hypothetical protein
MWPGDLKVLSDRLDNLPTAKGFPAGSRPYIYMEVIDQGIPLELQHPIKNQKCFIALIRWRANYGQRVLLHRSRN